LACVNF